MMPATMGRALLAMELAEQGETTEAIGSRLGVAPRTVYCWRNRLRAAGALPPARPGHHGPAPIAPGDHDWAMVDRLLNGGNARGASPADVYAAWRKMEADGLSAAQIANRLYVTPRTVYRWRRAERARAEAS